MAKNLSSFNGTFSSFVTVHSLKLAELKTKEELQAFLNDGLVEAVKMKHMTAETADRYRFESAELNVRKLQAYIYNLALAGDGLKTVKVS
jgi:hypothetical protein